MYRDTAGCPHHLQAGRPVLTSTLVSQQPFYLHNSPRVRLSQYLSALPPLPLNVFLSAVFYSSFIVVNAGHFYISCSVATRAALYHHGHLLADITHMRVFMMNGWWTAVLTCKSSIGDSTTEGRNCRIGEHASPYEESIASNN